MVQFYTLVSGAQDHSPGRDITIKTFIPQTDIHSNEVIKDVIISLAATIQAAIKEGVANTCQLFKAISRFSMPK